MKAKNLECDEVFVKFYLIQNGKRIKKKKTNFSKADHSWNEAFTFNLPSSSFNNSGLEVSFRRFSNLCYMTFPLLALRFGERIGWVERHWLLRNWLRREHRKGRHNRSRSLARHDPQSEEADALLASNRAVVIQSNQNLVWLCKGFTILDFFIFSLLDKRKLFNFLRNPRERSQIAPRCHS